MSLLAPGYLLSEGAISEVDEEMCRGCGRCEEICPYKAIELHEREIALETRTIKTIKAHVNPGVCKGCGLCVVTCPVSAIKISHFQNETISAQVDAILMKQEPTDGIGEQPPVEAP
jgi:heterodisulfide reductase subunit A